MMKLICLMLTQEISGTSLTHTALEQYNGYIWATSGLVAAFFNFYWPNIRDLYWVHTN